MPDSRSRVGRSHRGMRAVAFAVLGAALTSPVPAGAGPPVLDVDGMTFVASRGDVPDVRLTAVRARFDTGNERAFLEGVHAIFREREDRDGFEMTCDRGEFDLASNDFIARGNVRGRTEDGRVFTAPWVQYDSAQGLLFTDASVQITEEAGTFRGHGFRYWVRERRFRLLGGASVVQEK